MDIQMSKIGIKEGFFFFLMDDHSFLNVFRVFPLAGEADKN